MKYKTNVMYQINVIVTTMGYIAIAYTVDHVE